MNRTIANLWLDLVALLLTIGLMLTGGIIHFVLPPGTGHSLRLFGLGRHDYGEIHFWLAALALGVLVLHIVLHWSFVCGVVAKSFNKERPGSRQLLRWGLGVVTTTVLLPIVLLVWSGSQVQASVVQHRDRDNEVAPMTETNSSGSQKVQNSALKEPITAADTPEAESEATLARMGKSNKHEESCSKGAAINGRSTLGEAAAAAGLSVEALSKALALTAPPEASARLGRLRRQSGLSIHEVRKVICR